MSISIEERLARIETTLETLVTTVAAETRSRGQLWSAVDPLIHSDPPIPTRVRALEDGALEARTRDRVWRGIATFVSPAMTGLLVAWATGALG